MWGDGYILVGVPKELRLHGVAETHVYPGKTSEDHEHMVGRIWPLICGNADEPRQVVLLDCGILQVAGQAGVMLVGARRVAL